MAEAVGLESIDFGVISDSSGDGSGETGGDVMETVGIERSADRNMGVQPSNKNMAKNIAVRGVVNMGRSLFQKYTTCER